MIETFSVYCFARRVFFYNAVPIFQFVFSYVDLF